jgi:molybdopterin-guanine dinucleotide biosynthesis protein A
MGSDKLSLVSDTGGLLERVCRSAALCCDLVVVAGPERSDIALPVTFVLEDPPWGGPVAGISAAVEALPADTHEVLLLAGDLANPERVIELLASEPLDHDAVLPVDSGGWPQYLAGLYRAPALRTRIAALPDSRDLSVRRLFSDLDSRVIDSSDDDLADVDTPEDAQRWNFRHAAT